MPAAGNSTAPEGAILRAAGYECGEMIAIFGCDFDLNILKHSIPVGTTITLDCAVSCTGVDASLKGGWSFDNFVTVPVGIDWKRLDVLFLDFSGVTAGSPWATFPKTIFILYTSMPVLYPIVHGFLNRASVIYRGLDENGQLVCLHHAIEVLVLGSICIPSWYFMLRVFFDPTGIRMVVSNLETLMILFYIIHPM